MRLNKAVVNAVKKKKKSRCWKGYEPVPGKEPYSEGSCRPKKNAKLRKKK